MRCLAIAVTLCVGVTVQSGAQDSPGRVAPWEDFPVAKPLQYVPETTVQPDGPLAGLAFMSGCWRGEPRVGTALEEVYTSPSTNLILGLSRFLRDGRAVQFEFSTITADSSGVVLLPYPGGRPSEHGFRLTQLETGSALFEAPEHDFPRRISYTLTDNGELVARIDGGAGDPRVQEWRMAAASCSA